MTLKILAALTLTIAPAAAAAMPVSTFLAKADSLRKKGPLAMLSGDLKLLIRQIKADAKAIRAESRVAEAQGKRKAFCPPPAGIKIGQKEVLEAMKAVPAGDQARTDTKDALRAYLTKQHPCPAA